VSRISDTEDMRDARRYFPHAFESSFLFSQAEPGSCMLTPIMLALKLIKRRKEVWNMMKD
jgi:hypothetical protein